MISRPWIRNLLGLHSPSRAIVDRCRCRRCRRCRRNYARRESL